MSMIASAGRLRLGGSAALAVGLLAYSHDGIFSRMAVADPALVAAGRFTVAALAVWPLAWARHAPALRAVDGRTLLLTLAAGTCLGIDLTLWVGASQLTTIANSLILTHLAPIWLLLATIGSRRSWPPMRSLLVVLVSVAGAAIVACGSLGAPSSPAFHGDLLAASSSLFTAAYLLLSRAACERLATLPYLACSFGWAALLLWLWALASVAMPPSLSLETLLGIVGMGLVAQLFGQGLITFSLRWFTPGFVAVSCLVEPALGALLALAYLGEAITLLTLAGGVFVLLGIHLGARSER